jgi:hypothetical protein
MAIVGKNEQDNEQQISYTHRTTAADTRQQQYFRGG